MKKLFVLLLSVFVVMNVFATTGTTEESVGDSKATLKLTLENQYKFAFIAAATTESGEPTIGTGSVNPLSEFKLSTTGDALTFSGDKTTLELDEAKNVFYFFYQAYTNQGNLKIKISAPYSLKKDDDPSQTISYKASFEPVSNKWDGEALSRTSITSGSGTSGSGTSASAYIKDPNRDFDDFNYIGLCKVTISSVENEDLGKKKPGDYSANIYLNLTAN